MARHRDNDEEPDAVPPRRPTTSPRSATTGGANGGDFYPNPKDLHAARRAMQNPYAFIEQLEEDHAEAAIHAIRRMYQNQYAFIEYFESGVPQPATDTRSTTTSDQETSTRRGAQTRSVAKRDFRSRTRQIFLGYLPAEERRRGRLRAHHREFITRNENRSGEERARLLAQLEKYNVSDDPMIRPFFNREDEPFTESKLRRIEKLIDNNEDL